MTNIKCFFLRLYLLTYSPVFPILLGSTIFIVYRIYFEPVLLCDSGPDWALMKLKLDLAEQVASWRCTDVRLEEYLDKEILLREMPDTNQVKAMRTDCQTTKLHWRNQWMIEYNKTVRIENAIRKLDPNYRSVKDESIEYSKVYKAFFI